MVAGYPHVLLAVPHIIAGGQGGAIVMTCSVAWLTVFEDLDSYTASKHHPTQVDRLMIQNESLCSMFVPSVGNPTKDNLALVPQSMNVKLHNPVSSDPVRDGT